MLKISSELCDKMIAHCQSQYPKEACGFLVANAAGRIEHVYPMRNVQNSAIGYEMDPKEQLLAEKQLRREGKQVVAIYHSHTATDAYPSPVDVSLAISPDISYVLVSLRDRNAPIVKSYRIDGQTIIPEAVSVQGLLAG